MFLSFNPGARVLKCILLAFAVLFAQHAAQLHVLGHVEEELAQPYKGKTATHSIEQCCIAFHAVGSALTSTVALYDFDSGHTERVSWFRSEARTQSVYRLPARAPPQSA